MAVWWGDGGGEHRRRHVRVGRKGNSVTITAATVTATAAKSEKTTRPEPERRLEHRRLTCDSEAEIAVCFERWREHREPEAREALVQRFLPLARKLARRYARSSEPFDDLLQVASLGLLRAIDRFDPERGRPFTALAVPTILGELRRHFRDTGWAVHVPRAAQEQALMVEHAQRELAARHGRSPAVAQIAEYLEVEVEDVLSSLQVAQAYTALSLDAPRAGSDEDPTPYREVIAVEDERFGLLEDDVCVRAALRQLPPRERRVLQLRFVRDMTQSEIAAEIGVSQMQVSRLLRRSLERLREIADPQPAEASD